MKEYKNMIKKVQKANEKEFFNMLHTLKVLGHKLGKTNEQIYNDLLA